MNTDQQTQAIFSMDAAGIRRAIMDGTYTAIEVTETYIQRNQAANKSLNAVVVPLYEQARQRAKELDRQRLAGEPCGPLHGVPISIKESFDYPGTPTTGGIRMRADHRADQCALMVQRLEAAGAVVLGKTNVPELLVYLESDNPLYGRTQHPLRTDRSPGGSSGGEGAIVAAGGAVFGLGTDIGGSIRVPAHFCGIHGLKPTSRRLSVAGSIDQLLARGQEAIVDQPGPLARHMDDVILAYQVLSAPGQELEDGQIPPVASSAIKAVEVKHLKVGYYTDDGFFTPAPAMRRAVDEAVNHLRAQGIQAVPFQPPAIERAMAIYFGLLAADGGQWVKEVIGPGPHDRRLRDLLRLVRLPRWLRSLVARLLELAGQSYLARGVKQVGRLSVHEYWQLMEALRLYQQEFSRCMTQAGVDLILCPVAATPAFKHGASYYLTGVASYTMLYNLLGLPAGCVAASTVRAEEESDRPASGDWVMRAARAVEQGSAGLPVGVQVVGRHWREDQVLAMMKYLETQFRKA